MAPPTRPRFGSLQFWPRKRARKFVPRVNWNVVKSEGIGGVIAYKVGMGTVMVKDKTPHSMTLNKKVALPVTILEVPKFKIFSVRFYKDGEVVGEKVISNDKILKKKIKLPKVHGHLDKAPEHDQIRIIVYPVMTDMFKKNPDFSEVAFNGDFEAVKKLEGKEISFRDFFKSNLVDVRGLTKGKGFSGAVARFGISLRSHKAEKGVRRPGSLGPWHPARVTYYAPMAGQLGMFTRVHYNLRIIHFGSSGDGLMKVGFKNYGLVRNDYVLVTGSVQGPAKRQILLTPALRPSKKMNKKNYEFLELMR
ncbi:MAG: 50S ribosomal protein L3 [Nanoarchaeota archaeon]